MYRERGYQNPIMPLVSTVILASSKHIWIVHIRKAAFFYPKVKFPLAQSEFLSHNRVFKATHTMTDAQDSVAMCPAPFHSVCIWELSLPFSPVCLWLGRVSLCWLEAQGCISITVLQGGADTLFLYPVTTQALPGPERRLYHMDGLIGFNEN